MSIVLMRESAVFHTQWTHNDLTGDDESVFVHLALEETTSTDRTLPRKGTSGSPETCNQPAVPSMNI